MPWSRGSLLAALLALPASFVFADTVKVSGSCALPDAVAYLNLPAASRDSPLNGCMREEDEAFDTHVIQLPVGGTSTIASEVVITTSLTIKGAAAEEEVRPVINVASTGSSGRAFRIEVPVPAAMDTASTVLDLVPDASVDGGVSSTDHHTPYGRAVFKNNATRTAGSPVYLCRYDETVEAINKWVLTGTGTVASDGTWQITPSGALSIGVNTISVADVPTCDTVEADSIQVSVYVPLQVSFSGLNIQRNVDCGASCPVDGGLVHSGELLYFDAVTVTGGKATARGGAIFLAGEGGLLMGSVEFSGNAAPQGAVVYATRNTVSTESSLFTGNTGNTIIEVENDAGVFGAFTSTMVNSTFSGNAGLALSMRAGALLNGLTIVGNTLGGIDFHSANIDVHNSIVAGNGTADCVNLLYTAPVAASDPDPAVLESPVFKFNVTGAGTGCTASVNAAGSNSKEFTGTLMAEVNGNGEVIVDGALLPLADNGGALRTHLPRLRANDDLYRNLADGTRNPIINQGYQSSLPGAATGIPCSSTDQRDESRSGSCDIGAVEVKLISGTTFSGGQFESAGPSQSFSLRDDMGDEELLPSARCSEVSSSNGSAVAPVQGCPWLLVQPTKGSVTFNADGTYTYTPFTRFHGFDEFYIQVTTTVSILNDGTDALVKSRSVRGQVFMDPDTSVTSESLLDGGAMDWWFLMLGVLMLGGRVRWSK